MIRIHNLTNAIIQCLLIDVGIASSEGCSDEESRSRPEFSLELNQESNGRACDSCDAGMRARGNDATGDEPGGSYLSTLKMQQREAIQVTRGV